MSIARRDGHPRKRQRRERFSGARGAVEKIKTVTAAIAAAVQV
jgi:hypothetical protein